MEGKYCLLGPNAFVLHFVAMCPLLNSVTDQAVSSLYRPSLVEQCAARCVLSPIIATWVYTSPLSALPLPVAHFIEKNGSNV